jgi:putative transcriptional regulator
MVELSNLYIVKNHLRELRVGRGLTQAEVAAGLGVSRQTVIAIEHERYSPSLPLAFRIAQYFAMSVEQIFEPRAGLDE